MVRAERLGQAALLFLVLMTSVCLAGALMMVAAYAVLPEKITSSPTGAVFWREFMFYLAVVAAPALLWALGPSSLFVTSTGDGGSPDGDNGRADRDDG